MLDLVVVEVKILDCRQRTKYFWVEVRDEVLSQTESLEMGTETRESELANAVGIEPRVDELDVLSHT